MFIKRESKVIDFRRRTQINWFQIKKLFTTGFLTNC